jgi:hypothetical protein
VSTIVCRSKTISFASSKDFAKQPSFELDPGQRRLGHRDSDVMWLNEALELSERVCVGVRRPADLDPGVWNQLSTQGKLALIQGSESSELGALAVGAVKAATSPFSSWLDGSHCRLNMAALQQPPMPLLSSSILHQHQ